MASDAADIGARVAARVRAKRTALCLTLDALAARSGVSRAMLSRVERGESSPTAGVLAKLCDGLGVTLAALIAGDAGAGPSPNRTLARREAQPVWRAPGSGYLRRAVSPADSRIDIAELEMTAGAAVLLDRLDRPGADQHLWVLDGAVEVAHGGELVRLDRGDCLRLAASGPTGFRNAGAGVARCAVVTGRPDGGRMPA